VLLRDSLRKRGFDVDAVNSAQQCLERLRTDPADVVVTDVQMAGMSGIELCQELRQRHPDLLPLVLTGQGGLETAIAAIRAGAYDFITKPVKVDALAIAVGRALENLSLRREVKRLRSHADRDVPIDGIAGTSPAIRETIELVRRVSDSDATVLITGESGTGKELVARALHFAGRRASHAFMPVNCGALVGSLLDSELFGHVRGAFTGADATKRGLFVAADGGTLFLDEIGELPLELQPKLLRALQAGEIKPVGGTTSVRVDARVIAATNRPLEDAIRTGTFREDLFYRLAVITLEVPPLRNRPSDIAQLARHFADDAALRAERGRLELTDAAVAYLTAQPWPGNVRELENMIERAVILATGNVLDVADIAPRRPHLTPNFLPAFTSDHVPSLDELERAHILRVLELCEGQKTKAAALLRINRTTLWKKLRQYGLDSE